jgi:hypothetical protein
MAATGRLYCFLLSGRTFFFSGRRDDAVRLEPASLLGPATFGEDVYRVRKREFMEKVLLAAKD